MTRKNTEDLFSSLFGGDFDFNEDFPGPQPSGDSPDLPQSLPELLPLPTSSPEVSDGLPEVGFFDKIQAFVESNWSVVRDFGAQQSEVLSRKLEQAKVAAQENPTGAAIVLSIAGVVLMLFICVAYLKFRRRSGESRPLLGTGSFSRSDDCEAIGRSESERKIAEQRKKMNRKSVSRFSVDFDRFNADIRQCASGIGSVSGPMEKSDAPHDEISSSSVPGRCHCSSIISHVDTPTQLQSHIFPKRFQRQHSNPLQLDNDHPKMSTHARGRRLTFPSTSGHLRDDWIDEDYEHILFVSRTNSMESSATVSSIVSDLRDDPTVPRSPRESFKVRSRNFDIESLASKNAHGNDDLPEVVSEKLRTASGSFSDDASAGYCSETGSATPELTV